MGDPAYKGRGAFPPALIITVANRILKSNDRIKTALGMEFRTLSVSMRDGVESLLSVAEVQPKSKTELKPLNTRSN